MTKLDRWHSSGIVLENRTTSRGWTIGRGSAEGDRKEEESRMAESHETAGGHAGRRNSTGGRELAAGNQDLGRQPGWRAAHPDRSLIKTRKPRNTHPHLHPEYNCPPSRPSHTDGDGL